MSTRELRHTIRCVKCKEGLIPFDNFGELNAYLINNKSKCCNSYLEYIGLHRFDILEYSIMIGLNKLTYNEK